MKSQATEIVKYAHQQGFTVYLQKLPGVRAYIAMGSAIKDIVGQDKIIVISKSLHPKERRELLAVALGFVGQKFDPETQTEFYYAFLEDENEEELPEIQEFIRNLLLPEKEFAKAYQKLDGKTLYDKVLMLSDAFMVPAGRVKERISQLEL